MKTVRKLLMGIGAGYILAIIFGFVIFQVELFQDGMKSLGIGQLGLIYFVGGLLSSLALMTMALSNPMRFKLIGIYPVVFLIVGSIGLQGMIEDSVGAASGASFQPAQMAAQMAQMVANLAFWLAPLVVTACYAFQIYDGRSAVDNPPAK